MGSSRRRRSTPLVPTAAASSPAGTTAPDFVPQSAAALGIPAPLRDTYNRWVVWSRGGHFSGKGALQDWANPAQLNRLTWFSAHDWKIPYPGETAILTPDQVPGHNLPTGFLANEATSHAPAHPSGGGWAR